MLILSLALVIREIVLQRVAVFVKKFVRTVSVDLGLSEAVANAAGGKIFISGSYRLGVHSAGDDLDILCVVPKHVSRDDFFTVFKRMLRKVKGISGILVSKDLTCIMTNK
jgi:poly(A) polymerase